MKIHEIFWRSGCVIVVTLGLVACGGGSSGNGAGSGLVGSGGTSPAAKADPAGNAGSSSSTPDATPAADIRFAP